MDMASASSQTQPSGSNSNENRTALTSDQQNQQTQHHLHALDVSEIRALISENLTKQELGVCILVCKKWSNDFIPLYWRTIFVPPHRTTRYSESALCQHGHHLRSLHAGRIEETSVFNQPSVDCLQHLDISTCGSKDKEDGGRGSLQEIIYRNRKGLMSLHWRCLSRDTTMERSFRLWPTMFQGLQALVELELSNWSLSRVDFLRMLIACPALRNLAFQAIEDIQETGGRQGRRSSLPHVGEPVAATVVASTATAAVTATHDHIQGNGIGNSARKTPPQEDEHLLEFQHATLEYLTFIGELIPSFLQHVPNITRLEIVKIVQGDFKDMDEQITKKHSCNNVVHLTLATECSVPLRYLSTVMAIPTLVFFEGIVPPTVLEDFLELILRTHSQTIETLLLHESNPPQAGFQFNVWRFFESCPRLVKLGIPYSLQNCVGLAVVNTNDNLHQHPRPSHYSNGSQLSATTSTSIEIPPFSEATLELKLYEPTREWVCKDLRYLQLRIKDMDHTRSMQQIPFDLCVDRLLPPEQKRDNSRRTRSVLERMILERLSGLEKLEELDIGDGRFTLTATKT